MLSPRSRPSDPLDLPPGEIHLWYTRFDAIDDEAILSRYRALLDEDERRREAKFHFERDRRCHLVTRALVRTTLARYLDVRPEELGFTANPFGKPALSTSSSPLAFNISHTRCLTILAVAPGGEIGVDVENIGRGDASIDIADRFFAPAEVTILRRAPATRRSLTFFELWTLKESYVKARGAGLSIPLNQFAFDFPAADRLSFSVTAEADDPSDWHFWQFRLAPDYVAALCARSGDHGKPALVAREARPLLSSRIVPLQIGRRSQ